MGAWHKYLTLRESFAMNLKEKATQVKVMDGDRPYYYYVTATKPKTMVDQAVRKHCARMGIVPTDALRSSAEIVEPKKKATVQETLRHWIAVVENGK